MKEVSLAIAVEIPEEYIEHVISYRNVDRVKAIDLILERKNDEQFLIDAISRTLINDGFVRIESDDSRLSARMNIVVTDEEYDRIFKNKFLHNKDSNN